jgi:hypothetical protein
MLYKFLSNIVLILDAMEEFWKPPTVDQEIFMYMRFAGSSLCSRAVVYCMVVFPKVSMVIEMTYIMDLL